MTDIDLAWLAGCFEGEGSVLITKARGRSLGTLACQVASTDRQMLDLFIENWPGKLREMHYGDANRRPAWLWQIGAKKAARFLESIRPYLRTDRVRNKVALALEYQASKGRVGLSRRAVDAGYREYQLRCYTEMKDLNRRGRRLVSA